MLLFIHLKYSTVIYFGSLNHWLQLVSRDNIKSGSIPTKFKLFTWYSLCQCICNHCYCRAVYQSNFFPFYTFTKKMMCYVNVFCPSMIDRIVCKCNCWLSCWINVACCCCSNPNSFRNDLNHIASLVADDNAWYSACADDVATDCCFRVCHDIHPSSKWNKNPLVDRLSSRSPPQSASHAPNKSTLSFSS